MGTLQEAMGNAGFKISESESRELQSSLSSLKKKFRRNACRDCGDDIQFLEVEGKMIPHNLDGEPHWKTCPFGSFAQRKSSLSIMKKLAVYTFIKDRVDLEEEVGLTSSEARIVHAVLEKICKSQVLVTADSPGEVIDNNTEDDVKEDLLNIEYTGEGVSLGAELKGDDPIGDPDEDLAPSEEFVLQVEEASAEAVSPKV